MAEREAHRVVEYSQFTTHRSHIRYVPLFKKGSLNQRSLFHYMTWSIRKTHIAGRDTSFLIDDRFGAQAPLRELPFLGWFGVFCRMDPGGAFWHPDETEILDRIEHDLIGLCEEFGRGWVVYVMRLDSPGIREYYLYHGANAQLDKVLPSLAATHPQYRIEFDQTADADWSRYREFLAVPN